MSYTRQNILLKVVKTDFYGSFMKASVCFAFLMTLKMSLVMGAVQNFDCCKYSQKSCHPHDDVISDLSDLCLLYRGENEEEQFSASSDEYRERQGSSLELWLCVLFVLQ